jgi:hypothetical protein
MLADFHIIAQAGRLALEVQLPGTARYALLDFIADELPRRRDHPNRRSETSETVLTDQLCDHLNSAARTAPGWNWFQFRTEVPDEAKRGRAIDLALKPCGAVLAIEGRRHTQFDTLLPIECKRLPTPKEKGRDEREYVVTRTGSTGGVQRFKFGHHGSAHRVAGMIGYVQEQTPAYWLSQVNSWIHDLAKETGAGWSSSDLLRLQEDNGDAGVCRLVSQHQRSGGLGEIELRHLWVKMN